MTGSNEQPSSCPACEATSLSYEEHIESWLCDECSYVIDSNSMPTEVGDPSDVVDDTLAAEKSEPVDWESQIAVRDKSEVNLIGLLSRLEEATDELPISEERVLRSGELIAEAWQTNFMHGRSQERTIGAVIYAVSREEDVALPPAMIAEVIDADKGSIKQTFRKLNRELNLNISTPLPQQFVSSLCIALDLSDEIKTASVEMLRQHELPGGNPIGIAAAAVYVSANQVGINLTLKELAHITGLAKETVWRHTSTFDNKN